MAAVSQDKEHKEDPAPAESVDGKADAPPAKKKRNPIVLLILAALVIVAVVFVVRYFVWSSNHVSTDDSTVSSDVISIAPQVTGTVVKVWVKDNQEVKKGQLLVELDDSTYKTAVAQAKANYDLAVAQSKGAVAQVGLTGQIGNAQIAQAQGTVEQNESASSGSAADVQRARSATVGAQAQVSSANAATKGAQANLQASIANRQKANDAVVGAQAVVVSAESSVKTAQANVVSAQASYDKARSDNQRAQQLLGEGAISAQEADQAAAAFKVADAQLQSAKQNVTTAQAAVSQHRAELATAQSQVRAAEAAVDQAKAQVQASHDQELAARESVNQAQAQAKIAQSNLQGSFAKVRSARGTLQQANTAPVQVEIQKSGAVQADAKVEQALAAWNDAKIQLDRTKIYAPMDGRISNKTVEVGALVAAGTPLMSEIPKETVWVTANFKETQMAHMKVGDTAEVEVDAVPGHSLKGHVESISGGTGATFALLPPDNATGNFTKVVQRIPVKISLDAGQPDMDRLRTGMSVTATITTGN